MERIFFKALGIEFKEDYKKGALEDIVGVLGKWLIIGIVIGIVAFVFFQVIKPKLDANSYAGDLQVIEQGLASYYSAYHKYPAGSGWSWDTNYAYVPQAVINKGWQYSCNSGTITIISPAITDAKTRELVRAKASSLCDNAQVNNNNVVCSLYNRPCY